MVKRPSERSKLIICFLTLIGPWCGVTPTNADEIEVNGLPCNATCQAWMGVERTQNITPSVVERDEPRIEQSTHEAKPASSKPTSNLHRPKMEATKTEHVALGDEHSAPNIPKTAAAKHVHPKAREAQANVPVPVSRPPIPSDLPAVAIDVPTPPKPKSQEPPHKVVEAVAVPDTGTRPAASVSHVSPPVPDGVVVRATPQPNKEPLQAAAPTAAVAPLPSQTPSALTPAPVDDAATPAHRAAVVPRLATPQPPDVVASLPSPADAGGNRRNDGHPSGNTQDGRLQPIPELAESPLPVTIGQISAEPRGTNVHILVVNVLQHEVNGVDVRCRARDTQGLQVAEATAHISSIATSDIALEQVIFPPEITPRDNKFTCETGKSAATSDGTP